ncbi:uncharacterized protein FTOL_11826 [Fusarium torulosum]|uniref:Carboxylesterase type B domain-containing protein n=1 Tax=Fusarium torulosum TaxID=33205 RepID=A0AAE8MIS3_9HYPO|nr:uncharacterized protein FTOL_11826 [Fusarium torulosum]
MFQQLWTRLFALELPLALAEPTVSLEQRAAKTATTFNGTGPAGACPQMVSDTGSTDFPLDLLGMIGNIPFVQDTTDQGEDCLSITVARPEGTKAGAKLPVLSWIFGGGFQLDWSSIYDGASLVTYGVNIKKPFIFVAFNYRVAGFGVMPGKQIIKDGSGNIGLLDHRMGLEWVADNIAAFGGNPNKATIWGGSVGAILVLD